jgi:hypothetical protein
MNKNEILPETVNKKFLMENFFTYRKLFILALMNSVQKKTCSTLMCCKFFSF